MNGTNATRERIDRRKSLRRRAALALLVAVLLTTASVLTAKPRSERRREPLEVSLNTRYDVAGRPVVAVHVTRPYRGLVFTRGDDGLFSSRLRVTATARRDGRQVAGEVAEARAVADDYRGTRSEARLGCEAVVVLPDDAPVELLIRAEVVGTSRWWERKLSYDPAGGGAIPWYFRDFAWNLPADGGEALDLAARVDSLVIEVGLGVRPGRTAAVADPGALRVVLLDGLGGEKVLARRPLPEPAGGDRTERLAFAADGFPFGLQALSVEIVDDRGGRLRLSPDHELVNLGIPFADDPTWRRHVDWLETVVPDRGERRRLSGLPAAARPEAWAAVWGARPPEAPDQAEHLARIVEADRRFGRFGRGALSDRGRTLILLGHPDRVDHHGMDPHVAGDWEVWYYRRVGVRVIFHDAYGLGDFRLYAEVPY